jgi:hypothetical protein
MTTTLYSAVDPTAPLKILRAPTASDLHVEICQAVIEGWTVAGPPMRSEQVGDSPTPTYWYCLLTRIKNHR